MTIVDQITCDGLDASGPEPGQCWLDIGCGPGVVTEMLAQRVGPD